MPDAAVSSQPKWTIWQVLKQSVKEFSEDKCPRLGAALAYYTIFSIAPMLVIAVGIFGLVMHRSHVAAHDNPIVKQATALIGGTGGEAIEKMVDATAQNQKGGKIATILGFVTLLFGATGVFGQLQDALNTIWEVAPKPGRGIWGFIRDRFLSFTMVGGICFLLLVSLVVTTALAAVNHFVSGRVPGLHYLWTAINFVVSVAVVSLLFAMMFKVLPDVKMKWKDTIIGAVATAVLFGIGKWAIGTYLTKAGVASAYGAVGSAVVLILWVYYSSQIVLLGAEFTHVYSCHLGSQYKPNDNAIDLTETQRANEGIPHDKAIEGHPAVRVMRREVAAKAAQPKREKPAAASSSPLLPATLGMAAGFLVGKIRRGPRGKRLVLMPGVKVVKTPAKLPPHKAGVVERFQKGFHRGVDRAK